MSATPTAVSAFSWFYRPDRGREDHVISLCSGHAYLTKKGGWKPGQGDLAPLPAAKGCCVCNGSAPTPRMKDAPLKPVLAEETKRLLDLVTEFREGIVDGIGGGSSAGMCDAVCFPLQGFLSFAEGIETQCKYGFFETKAGALQHYWLELENGEIIDPTADQLEAHGFPKLPGVYIGPRPAFYPESRSSLE